MKKWINIIIIAALIALVVMVLNRNKRTNLEKTELAAKASTAVPVLIDVVKEETLSANFTSNGTLEPVKELSFVSDVSGRIVSIKVEKGSRVVKGQTLANIDNEMLKADYQASEATYLALKIDYERFKNASENGGVTAQQLDNIRTQYISAESRYINSKRRLADATIKAPISGVINEKYIQIGALLNPGARLFDIVDNSTLKLRCSVSEQQVLQLKIGQSIEATCSAFPRENFGGSITFIGSKADRGFSYPIEITINEPLELKAGMYMTAHFASNTENTALLIPRNAVSGSVKSASVYVVKNGIAQQNNIVTGTMVGKKVQVLQGLQAGDSIVVSGLINIANGVKVINKE
ncbi:MAG TPA: efflux RND transporter periplasmic adaptor subunit [Prolixibacteraceae bacterium]|nr:efflux RND transporter periplasmic adaptor subunit [Prolixibacteraceae bacterium]